MPSGCLKYCRVVHHRSRNDRATGYEPHLRGTALRISADRLVRYCSYPPHATQHYSMGKAVARFVVPRIVGAVARVVGAELRHLRARRVRAAQEVELVDAATGRVHAARVLSIEATHADIGVLHDDDLSFEATILAERSAASNEASTPASDTVRSADDVAAIGLPNMTVAVGMPRNSSRCDWLVEKLAELGVATMQPLMFTRSVLQPSTNRVQRWSHLAMAANKQSHATLPDESTEPITHHDDKDEDALLKSTSHDTPHAFMSILEPLPLSRFIQSLVHSSATERIMLWGNASCEPSVQPVLRVLDSLRRPPQPTTPRPTPSSSLLKLATPRLVMVIGPEGGMTGDEERQLNDAGLVAVSISPHVLRVETAAVSLVSAVVAHHMAVHSPHR